MLTFAPSLNYDAIRRAYLHEAVYDPLDRNTRAVVDRLKGFTVHAEGNISDDARALVKGFANDFTMPGPVSGDVRAVLAALQYDLRDSSVSDGALKLIDAIL